MLELHAAGTTVVLLSHQLAEVELVCSRVGVLDRGRLVLQEALDELRGPTGRILVRTPDVDRARAVLDGRVEDATANGLVVRHAGARRAQRAAGRRGRAGGGARRRSVRTLEQAVLAATSAGSDRVARP